MSLSSLSPHLTFQIPTFRPISGEPQLPENVSVALSSAGDTPKAAVQHGQLEVIATHVRRHSTGLRMDDFFLNLTEPQITVKLT